MSATARGIFEVVDKATGPIKSIGRAAVDTTGKVHGTGSALDDLDSPKVIGSIKVTQKEVSKIGTEAEKSGAKIKKATEGASHDFEKMAAKGSASVEVLQAAIKDVTHEINKHKEFNLSTAKAEAKLRVLKHELRTVSTAEARKELSAMGLVAERATSSLVGGGAGGGGPPGVLGGLAGGFAQVGKNVGLMGFAILGALPAIVALTGALSALLGSLGAAAMGAGALGVAGLGATTIGLASIIGVAKPAMAGLKTVTQAQKAYNQAVQQYGNASAQAIAAHKKLDNAYKQSPGTKQLLQNWTVLKNEFSRATKPARSDFFTIMNEGVKTLHSLMGTTAPLVNKIWDQMTIASSRFFNSFKSPEWRHIITTMGDTFAKAMQPIGHAMQNLALFFGRIAVAASPILLQVIQAFDHWTGTLAGRVVNTAAMTEKIGRWVSNLRDWMKFFGATIKLMTAFFSAGAAQGQSALEGITKQLGKWTAWIQAHPAEMHAFFQRTIDAAGHLAHALGTLVTLLAKIADHLMPILNLVTNIVGLAGTGQFAQALALFGAYRFATRGMGGGFFGFGGGRGPGGAPRGAPGPGQPGGPPFGVAIGGATGAAGIRQEIAAGMRQGFQQGGRLSRYPQAIIGGFGAMGGMRGAGSLAMRGLGMAGRFLWPMAALGGLSGALSTPGNANERIQGALSGATMGLIPMPQTRAQARDAGSNQAAARIANLNTGFSIGDLSSRMAALRRAQARVGPTQAGGAPFGTPSGPLAGIFGGISEKQAAKNKAMMKTYAQEMIRTQRQLNIAMYNESVQMGSKMGRGLQSAFGIALQRTKDPHKAMLLTVAQIHRDMGTLRPQGQRTLAQTVITWARQMARDNPKLRRPMQDLINNMVSDWRKGGGQFVKIGDQIYKNFGDAWANLSHKLQSENEKMLESTSKSFTQIQKDAVTALKGLGFSGSDASKIIQAMEKGTSFTALGTGAIGGQGNIASTSHGQTTVTRVPGRAKGGRLPGSGLMDTVRLVDGGYGAPGELIINRHTERDIDQDLVSAGKAPMATRVGRELRPHSMPLTADRSHAPARDPVADLFAPRRAISGLLGGGLGSITSALGIGGGGSAARHASASGSGTVRGHPELHPGIAAAVSAVLAHNPRLVITSTTGGSHAGGSYHYKGEAADLAGPGMDPTASWITSTMAGGLTEGIHNPGLSVKYGKNVSPGFWGPVWAAHRNHIHLAVAGAFNASGLGGAGGAGGAAPTVKHQKAGGEGVWKVLSQRALDTKEVAANLLLQAAWQQAGGGGGGVPGSVASGPAQKMIFDFFSQAGMNKTAIAGLIGNAVQESNLNWNAAGGGMWQQISNFGSGAPAPIVQMQKMLSQIRASGVFARMNAASTPEQAAIIFEQGFERAGIPAMGHRTAAARAAFNAGFAHGGRLGPGFGGPFSNFAGAFAGGGSFTTNGPTSFVAGERTGRPHERVTVTPTGVTRAGHVHAEGTSGGGVQITVQIDKIEHHEPGDIEEHLQRELAAVARGLRVGQGREGDELG